MDATIARQADRMVRGVAAPKSPQTRTAAGIVWRKFRPRLPWRRPRLGH